jgi:hypothetical protein
MKDRDIDEILDRAAAPPVDAAILSRISASMGASMSPVSPLPAARKLASALLLLSAGIGVAAACALGVNGIEKMDVAQMGAMFPLLGIFIWLAALVSVAAMTPGGLKWKNPSIMEPVMTNPTMLLLVVMAGFLAVDAMLFHDYQMGDFVPEGIPCLRAGIIVAIPAGLASWLVLRSGFAVNRTAAGLAAGTLAGLAGLTMLEFHCANFHVLHIMTWHAAVLPFSALTGALAARFSASTK